MWNKEKSIGLSKWCVLVFMVLLIGTALSAPWLVRMLMYLRAYFAGTETYFLITIFTGCVPAAVLLFCLYRLLHHIETGQVFTAENVDYLRRISWSCFTGAIICFASVSYYLPWVFVAVAAAFMGLIVRVVKNVVAQAVELKNESDFTI